MAQDPRSPAHPVSGSSLSEPDWADEIYDKMDGNVCADSMHGPMDYRGEFGITVQHSAGNDSTWQPRFKLDCSECFKDALRAAKREGHKEATVSEGFRLAAVALRAMADKEEGNA